MKKGGGDDCTTLEKRRGKRIVNQFLPDMNCEQRGVNKSI